MLHASTHRCRNQKSVLRSLITAFIKRCSRGRYPNVNHSACLAAGGLVRVQQPGVHTCTASNLWIWNSLVKKVRNLATIFCFAISASICQLEILPMLLTSETGHRCTHGWWLDVLSSGRAMLFSLNFGSATKLLPLLSIVTCKNGASAGWNLATVTLK